MRTVKLRMPVTLAVLAAFFVASSAAAAPGDELKRARSRLEEVREQLEKVSTTCERNERKVDTVNERVEATLVAVGEAEVAVDGQRRVVDESRRRMDELQARADTVSEISSGRVVELYKRGVLDPTLHSLLMSSSTEQALSRAQVLNVVKHGDREALEQLLSSKTAADGQRKVYEQQQRAYETALREREDLLDELQDLRKTYERKIAACNDKVVKLKQQERIAADDEAELAAALADQGEIVVPPSVSSGGWTWPTPGTVTSGFGYRWGRLHAGIDIGASTGTPIYAARGGVVSYAGTMGGYGNIIVVDHGGGMTTRYAHQSQLGASVGQTVGAGARIGSVGSTGNSTGPHLHFEVRINDQPQNPMGYLP
ncbi:MAG: peptidoglycan DD-metalloendopeptidase family protein [Actinobacteria bacterium]|nr:peptidoglycan DD-metalloendopeptidase family protein [Actinomycetota bacterium]